jgi:hypothetical protein
LFWSILGYSWATFFLPNFNIIFYVLMLTIACHRRTKFSCFKIFGERGIGKIHVLGDFVFVKMAQNISSANIGHPA